jgi:hypothetical protein
MRVGIDMTLVNRQLLGHPEGMATGDNGHLMDGIGTRRQLGYQGMAGLVIGGVLFLFVGDDHAATLRPHEHLILGLFELILADTLPA